MYCFFLTVSIVNYRYSGGNFFLFPYRAYGPSVLLKLREVKNSTNELLFEMNPLIDLLFFLI